MKLTDEQKVMLVGILFLLAMFLASLVTSIPADGQQITSRGLMPYYRDVYYSINEYTDDGFCPICNFDPTLPGQEKVWYDSTQHEACVMDSSGKVECGVIAFPLKHSGNLVRVECPVGWKEMLLNGRRFCEEAK